MTLHVRLQSDEKNPSAIVVVVVVVVLTLTHRHNTIQSVVGGINDQAITQFDCTVVSTPLGLSLCAR